MPMEGRAKITLDHVSKSFVDRKGTAHPVLRDVNLEVRDKEFLVLLGAGKSGKTVLLDLIMGLDPAYEGEIRFADGKLEPKDFGVVFQKYVLFPWKTVMENVEMNQKYRGMNRAGRREKAMHYLRLVGLEGFEHHYPSQISGGMKQRVGIARAFAGEADILLMDEPFGALDAQTRYQMEAELLRIWEEERRTVVFVTNNIEEAVYLGDRIILLEDADGEQKVYTPELSRPRSYTSEAFLSLRNQIAEDFPLVL